MKSKHTKKKQRELLAASKLCDALALKFSKVVQNLDYSYTERARFNAERIALWEASTIMKRESCE